jgi:acetyl/propionyl-CoA carboxylase alpha subunit
MQGVLHIDGATHALAVACHGGGHYAILGRGAVRIGEDASICVDGAPVALQVLRHGDRIWVHFEGETRELIWQRASDYFSQSARGENDLTVRAPMPGAVVTVLAAPGQSVDEGDPLIVIESMKLETTLRAPRRATVAEVNFAKGDTFDRDAVLIVLTDAT